MGAPIRVLLLDHDTTTRQMIRASLNDASDILVVGEAASDQALNYIQALQPDVILWAICVTDLPTIARVQRGRIIALTPADQESLRLEALRAGAAGHLDRETIQPGPVIAAVRAVHRGEAVLSPPVAGRILDQVLARRRGRET